jgi:tRNA(Ile)-lysidine synthase
VLVRHLLGRLLTSLGGHEHPPRGRALDGALAALRDRRAVTAHGCLLRPWRGGMLLAREPAAIAAPVRVGALAGRRWDGRFEIAAEVPDDWEILAPGAADWRKAVGRLVPPAARRCDPLPGAVRAGMPAFRCAGRIVAVPFEDAGAAPLLRFAPRNPLIRGGLRVALPVSGLI